MSDSAVVSIDQLDYLLDPAPRERARKYVEALNNTMDRYDINTFRRRTHFLAQMLHESGMLRFKEEIWGPTPAQQRYEGRIDLGNTKPGDGFRFRGRGLIQLTGRANYAAYTLATGIDYLENPDLVAERPAAVDVAGWFWHRNGINRLADLNDINQVTRRINGGFNGLRERVLLLRKARFALMGGVLPLKPADPEPHPITPPQVPDTL